MKGWIVILIVLGVWIAYKRDHTFSSITSRVAAPRRRQGSGVISPRSRGYNTSSLGTGGYTSPGSGAPYIQPALTSSWGIGSSGINPGIVGVQVQEGQ